MNPIAALTTGLFSLLCLMATPVGAQSQDSVSSDTGTYTVETLAEGLSHPWGMAFLPDGRLLVTEREGRLRILGTDHRLAAPIPGTPQVFAAGQGGLLDVALDPDFATNGYLYLSYAEPEDRKSTRLNSSHVKISYAVFCLKNNTE